MLKRISALFVFLAASISPAAAEDITIHFVAAAFALKSDSAPNTDFSSVASRVRWDIVMPGSISENGFVSINGPKVKVRNTDGQTVYKTKSGTKDCTANFTDLNPAHVPSSAQLVKLEGDVAYIRIGTPQTNRLFQDPSAAVPCMLPNFSIFATFPDGSLVPGSDVKNEFNPATYRMDGPLPGNNVNNHSDFAEFPINVKTLNSGPHEFRFVHTATAGTSSNKYVWFGKVQVFQGDDKVPTAADAFTLGGYLPPSDPSTQPPANPPVGNLGGGGSNGTPTKKTVVPWIKNVINTVMTGGLNLMNQTVLPAHASGYAAAIAKGDIDYDVTTNAVGITTAEAAPFSGTLKITLEFTSGKSGAVTTVKIPAVKTTQGQGTSINFSAAGKLTRVLKSAGKIKVKINTTFKATGSKTVFTASSKATL